MSAFNRLKLATLMVTVALAGVLSLMTPGEAQEVTILRGSGPSPSAPAIDCNNPDYAQYCQSYDASQEQSSTGPGYADAYPYYDDYGVFLGGAPGSRFAHHRRNFRPAFHPGGFHAGFQGGGFHGGGGRH